MGPGFTSFAALYRDGIAEVPAADVSPDDPFAVISTAAVDVVPRGAVLSHANVMTATLTAIGGMGFTGADRYLLALPLFHITALGGAMAHLHVGGANVVVSRFDAEDAVRLIDRHRITHVSDFPPVLSSLLDAAERLGSRLPSLRHVSGLDAPPTIQRLHEQTARPVLDRLRAVGDQRVRHPATGVRPARRRGQARARVPRQAGG